MSINETTSRSLCSSLVRADGADEVQEILDQHEVFQDPENWRNYGDVPNNFGVISNQQSDSTSALVEKIINSEDAILQYLCHRRGIDPESDEAPQSVEQAMEYLLDIPDGDLTQVTDQEYRRRLAENIWLVASGEKKDPSFSIIDQGLGQHPEDFHETFLSLQNDNKLKIPFVQGKFNMGATGVLPFAENGFQLILSRRHPDIAGKDSPWGWTIVKKRPPEDKEKSPVYVYFTVDGEIPSFSAPEGLPLLPDQTDNELHEGILKGGSFIKLYSYEITPQTVITLNLYRRLNLHVFDLPCPVTMYEGRDYKSQSRRAILEGMDARLRDERFRDSVVEKGFPLNTKLQVDDGEYANVKIWLLKDDVKTSDWIRKSQAICFTINGQVHASWDGRFFSRNSVQKDYLKNNLLMEVDCSDLSADLVSELFMGSRDRMRDIEFRDRMERQLEKTIREDSVLQEYNQRWREKQIEETFESEDQTKTVLQTLMDQSPEISELLGEARQEQSDDRTLEGGESSGFEGDRFPTFLSRTDEGTVEIPVDSWRKVRFETNVENNYFDRKKDPGDIQFEPEEWVRSVSLRNGNLILTLKVPEDRREVGLETDIELEMHSPIATSGEGFRRTVPVRVVDPVAEQGEQVEEDDDSSEETAEEEEEKDSRVQLPQIQGIREEKWDLLGWDEDSVAEVQIHERGTDVYVNLDNDHLQNFIRDREWASQTKKVENVYRIGIGLFAFALRSKLGEDVDDEVVEKVYEVISSVWLPAAMQLEKIL